MGKSTFMIALLNRVAALLQQAKNKYQGTAATGRKSKRRRRPSSSPLVLPRVAREKQNRCGPPPTRFRLPEFILPASSATCQIPSRSSCLVTCPACSNLEVMHIRNFKIMSVRPSRTYTVRRHPLEFKLSHFGPYLGKR